MAGMACMVCARCWAQDESKFCIPSNLFRYNEADSRAWEQSSSAVSGNRFGTSKWLTWDGVSRRNEIEEGRGRIYRRFVDGDEQFEVGPVRSQRGHMHEQHTEQQRVSV